MEKTKSERPFQKIYQRQLHPKNHSKKDSVVSFPVNLSRVLTGFRIIILSVLCSGVVVQKLAASTSITAYSGGSRGSHTSVLTCEGTASRIVGVQVYQGDGNGNVVDNIRFKCVTIGGNWQWIGQRFYTQWASNSQGGFLDAIVDTKSITCPSDHYVTGFSALYGLWGLTPYTRFNVVSGIRLNCQKLKRIRAGNGPIAVGPSVSVSLGWGTLPKTRWCKKNTAGRGAAWGAKVRYGSVIDKFALICQDVARRRSQ